MHIDLKSIHCSGCGQLYTSPPSINRIAQEFRVMKTRKFDVEPEVIDEDTDELRKMTSEEKQKHVKNFKSLMESEKNIFVKKFKKNKFNVIKVKTEKNKFNVIKVKTEKNIETWQIKVDMVKGVVEKSQQDNKKTVKIRCPNCNKSGYTVTFPIKEN